jgi:hypothetical protein
MMPFLSALCILGIVVIALLLTVSAISMEQAGKALWRCLVAFMLAMWVICILRGLAAVALPALKTLTTWVATAGLVLVGILMVAGLTLRITKLFSNRVNHERGEP